MSTFLINSTLRVGRKSMLLYFRGNYFISKSGQRGQNNNGHYHDLYRRRTTERCHQRGICVIEIEFNSSVRFLQHISFNFGHIKRRQRWITRSSGTIFLKVRHNFRCFRIPRQCFSMREHDHARVSDVRFK